MLGKCPVCKRNAEVSRPRDGAHVYDVDCQLCGKYRITETLAASEIEQYGQKHIISGVIRNRSEKGEIVELHTGNLKALLESVVIPTDPFDRINLLLEHILNKTGDISNTFKTDSATNYPLLFLESKEKFVFYLFKAKELDYLSFVNSDTVELTLKGWKRLDEIKKGRPRGNQAFVAMWFDVSLDEAWEKGFKPALEECAYVPIRVDMQEHNEKICDKIIAEIRKSSLLVADFTGQRGGVYFESGFAHGLGIPIIWMCRESDKEKLHFDTRQYNHIIWENPDDLKTKLVNRIKATVPYLR